MALEAGDPARLGSYELIDRLGAGGQGTVYLGRGPEGEPVAIKLLHPGLIRDQEARQRFFQEVALAQRVARFCTAPVLHADLAGDQPFIVSEYVPGPSLRQLVDREGPRRGAALERLAISTATALAAIHRAGITHRDFKPANVLMGPEGPVVIDFGVARALDSPQTTGTGTALGTPAYFAPELLAGSKASAASDMFSWGVTMVFAATGTPAFGADSLPSVVARILHSPPDLGGLSGPLRDIVADCLSKDPAARPSAEDVVTLLTGRPAAEPHAALAVPSLTVPSLTVPGPAVPGPARKKNLKRRAAAVAAVVTAGVVTTGVVLVAVDTGDVAGGAGAAPVAGTAPATGTAATAGSPQARPSTAQPGHTPGTHRRTRVASPTDPAARAPEGGAPSGTVRSPQTATGGASGAPERRAAGTTPRTSVTPVASPSRTPSPAPSRAPSASPAPARKLNPYSAAAVCGSGFAVVDSHSLSGGNAVVFLLYNASAGKNCVITRSKYVITEKIKMSAVLKVQGGASASDSGQYTAYAGPLRLAAARKCVIWGGAYGTASWTSGWSHCA